MAVLGQSFDNEIIAHHNIVLAIVHQVRQKRIDQKKLIDYTRRSADANVFIAKAAFGFNKKSLYISRIRAQLDIYVENFKQHFSKSMKRVK